MRKPVISCLIAGALLGLAFSYFSGSDASPARGSDPFSHYPELTTTVEYEIEVLLPGTPFETPLHIIRGREEGPAVLVLGGVHGNEISGYLAADEMRYWTVDRGILLVIPRANPPAIEAGARTAFGNRDLNRSLPGDIVGTYTERMAFAIFSVMDRFRPQWVLDLHEAPNFQSLAPGSLGQTLIFAGSPRAEKTVELIIEEFNRDIQVKHHQLLLLKPVIPGSTVREAHDRLGLDGVVVEICSRLDLPTRIRHQSDIVTLFLRETGLLY